MKNNIQKFLSCNILTERDKAIIKFIRHNRTRTVTLQYNWFNMQNEPELEIVKADKIKFYINSLGVACVKTPEWETMIESITNIFVMFE